jgi:hypothetical protein
MRKRQVTKKQFTARVNIFLADKIDEYVQQQNNKGISTKKIDVIEKAFYDFLKKEGMINEEQ